MELTQTLHNGTMEVRMSGHLTFAESQKFRDVLTTLAADDVRAIQFHLAQLQFIDSAGLGMLLLARDAAEKQKKNISLQGAQGQPLKMFEVSRFRDLFVMV